MVTASATVHDLSRVWRAFSGSSRLLAGAASIAFVLAMSQLPSSAGLISQLIFSSPGAIAREAATQFSDGEFWQAAWRNAVEFIIGFGLAALVGIPLGICVGRFRNFGYFVDPWLNVVYALPRIALTPLLVIAVHHCSDSPSARRPGGARKLEVNLTVYSRICLHTCPRMSPSPGCMWELR